MPTGQAASRATPQWAIVFPHVDYKLGDVIGLDVLGAGDRSARALTRRPPGSQDHDDEPVWSPDGRRVAFVRSNAHEGLYVVAASGGESHRLATGHATSIAWSPDGARVAFSRHCARPSASCRPGVYVVRTDGTTGLQLLFASSERGFASWSPDGRRLVCLCSGAVDTSIYTFDSNGANRHLLSAQSDGTLGRASWSPDGRLIAFGRHCSEPSRVGGDVYCEVAVMNVNGTHKRTLVRRHGGAAPSDIVPAWFADSSLLIGEWGSRPDVQVVSVDPRSGAQRVIYHDVGWNLTPGPAHFFGFITQLDNQIGTERSTLLLVGGAGTVLVRRKLPFEPNADASLRIG